MTAFFFLATLFSITFEKLRWEVAGTVSLADILDLDVDNRNVGGVGSLDNVLRLDGDAIDSLTLALADGWGAADTTTFSGYAIYAVQNVRVAVDQDIAVSVA